MQIGRVVQEFGPVPLVLLLVCCAAVTGCNNEAPPHVDRSVMQMEADEPSHPVRITSSRQLGRLDQTFQTPAGQQTAGVPCSTCHASMVGGPIRQHPAELTNFHTDMRMAHGELSCSSCHAESDRDKLRLADGRLLEFEQTMQLCGQCHGPQKRDYDHGAHGGMSGYWDLGQGPRQRNHCVNCHDPHVPAYPKLQPAPPPRDRFLSDGDETHDSSATKH